MHEGPEPRFKPRLVLASKSGSLTTLNAALRASGMVFGAQDSLVLPHGPQPLKRDV